MKTLSLSGPMASFRRCAAAVLLALITTLAFASPALAHADFASSTPSDGARVPAGLTAITLAFTASVEPVGPGFEVLDPSGWVRAPDLVEASADGASWTLRFTDPLATGDVGVRWMVAAPDAHPIDGSFVFTIAEADPLVAEDSALSIEHAGTSGRADPAGEGAVALEDFLDRSGRSTSPRLIAATGRAVGFAAGLVGIGALVFTAAVLRGSKGDVAHCVYWVRRAGLLVMVGALMEAIGQLGLVAGGEWSSVWRPSRVADAFWGSAGAAIALRAAGGWLLAFGPRIVVTQAQGVPDAVVAIRQRIDVGADRPVPLSEPALPATVDPLVHPRDAAWFVGRESAPAFVGSALVIAAFTMDGHTVTEGNRVLASLMSVFHVAGAAVWVGGVAMLGSTLRRRHRQGRELRALTLALRFSVLATLALGFVALPGLALAVTILEGPSELWSTDWGRLLLAKTGLVAGAALLGGYNHHVLIPGLADPSTASASAHRFRWVLRFELGMLIGAIVITAALLGASS